ncbi:hypothetical protein LZQ00_01765 [Sphingobacterium sp. SRCM116780]|uniref:hypothetical protein n=1 Tax=Sphingobacterium sp. SRCM116780 TaxID=2907623 RepID=UPI001F40DA8D|nr:hypothetical protein [Sphingobacterium sp. SRCM116780]UIR56561.1 hypothetical protein LZQ00_01765 [Sphingobacterium sp. SRCM116780]
MIKRVYIVATCIIALLFTSCKKSNVNATSLDGLQVEAEAISGWCGSSFKVTVNKEKTEKQSLKSNCQPDVDNHTKSYKTNADLFKKLNDFILSKALLDTNIQECARCLDGEDYLITIKNNDQINKLSIANKEGEYKAFLDLIKQL